MTNLTRSPAKRPSLLVEELEPRILYSADAAVLLGLLPQSAETRFFDAGSSATAANAAARLDKVDYVMQGSGTTEIIFIDSRVLDAYQLADQLMQQRGEGRNFDIAILDANEDGIAQINRVLAAETNLAAIHIISHGRDGVIEIGNSRIDNERLAVDAAAVSRWGLSLARGGDLLLYGCDLAQGAIGQSFVQNLARITGADVAASSNLTGNAAQGGDWTLEYSVGRIETGVAASLSLQASWVGTMAISFDAASNRTGSGSSSITLAHTTGSGSDRLLIAGIDIRDNKSVSSVTYNGLALTKAGTVNNSDNARAEIWYLKMPTTGTFNLVVNFSGDTDAVVGAATYAGVDQATPLGNLVANTGSTIVASVNATSAPGEWVFDTVAVRDASTITIGSNQTQQWNNGFSGIRGGSSTEPGAGSTQMSWTLNVAGPWAIAAVAIKPANTAPTLDAAKSPTLSAVNEDAGAPIGAVGTVISALVNSGVPLNNVNDPDTGALLGIAVTGADNSNGIWHYSINNGSTWNPLGAVSGSNARLLAADARLYFQPNTNYNGTLSSAITFRAWDQTRGTNGGTANTTFAGGTFLDTFSTAAYSNNNGSMAWTGNWVENDAGTGGATGGNYFISSGRLRIESSNTGRNIYREANLASAMAASYSFDLVTNNLDGSSIIQAQVSGNGGGSWTTLLSITSSTPTGAKSFDISSFIAANTRIRFYDNNSGDKEILVDNVQITLPATTGGSSAISTATDTASLVVTPVNDAPVLDNTGTMALPNGLQDATDPAGITVAALIASAGGDRITDVDAGAVEGIAITAANSSIGTWQYSIDGGAAWLSVGPVSNSQARLLGATPSDMIRFVSNPGASGSATFSFRAWDRSDARPSGDANVDTSSTGGSTPFSTATQLARVYVEPLQVILWLSTSGDVTASGVPGVANWSQSSVLAVGDPGLSFGTNTTGGRITSVTDFDNFGSDVDIVGLHRVGRAITLTGAGIAGGSLSLLAGDMLFVTAAAENLSTAAGSPPAGWSASVNTAAGSVYAYRPATANDYSSGFFRQVTGNLGSNTTREIALVETATAVGGTALAAGDLLFTQTGTIQQNSIYWYRTGSNNNVQLINGAQVGIPGTGPGAAMIDSLDLIHGSFTAGGISFQAGDLLVGFDKQVTGVGGGASTLVAMSQDIVRMRFTATTFGSGTAVATAAMVFDGNGDAKFDTAAENIDAISLLIRSAGGNLPPTVTLPGPALAYTEGSGAVLVDASATVVDFDSTDMDTGVLYVEFNGTGTSNDRLGIRHQGVAAGQIGVAGSNISYGGVLIGSVAGGTSGSTPLVISLNINATPVAVQALLRNLTYTNVSNNPSTAPRTLRVLLSDGDGATSSAVTKTINVINVNDSPVAVADAYSTNEDTPLVIAPSTASLNNWWGFNEGGSSQTTASSGALGSSGTRGSTAGVDASDPSWNAGLLGGAGLSFTGGQYVQTDSTELMTASAFTLSAWFQTNSTTSAQHLIWQGYAGGNGYGNGSSTSPTTSEMSLSIGSHSAAHNNKIVFSLGYDVPANGADSIFIVSASDFTDTTRWHQVAVSVADIGGGVVRASLYVDGRLEGTGTGTQNDRSVWQALRIGAAGDGSRSFNGKIDEVRVYGAELTGAQILAVMQPGVLANDSDPDSAPLQVHPTLVSGPTNGTLAINADGSFTYTPNANFHGTDSFSYRATDGIANSNPATVTITVNPVADTPSVSNATTTEDTQSTSGLVISRNAADGAEVTHFKITGISNGTLYKNNGTTPIADGSFITFAEGNAGLKFTPATNHFGSGGFTVRASTSNLDAGLGGNPVSATITINPVAGTPSVSSTTTNEDTQSSSGLVISRNPADGPEVTHFKITGISNGVLFLNDAVTSIANGSFISFAQGDAGLKFTPSANFHGNAGFTVQASTSNLDAGLGGATVNATVTVNPVADTPSVSNTTTNEDTQSTSGLVISRNPADGAEVTHFKITGISNGTLFHNNGVTPINNGSFISFAEGSAGLKFTPAQDFYGTGSFTVQASTSNLDAGLGGGTATATITVIAVNDAPTIANLADDFLAYLPGSGAVDIDQGAGAVVADVDSANFSAGNLTVRFAAGGVNAQDVLAIRNQGTAAGQIGIAGASVTYGGTVIGNWSGGSAGTSLVVTLNANANPTSTSALVSNITYQNTAGGNASSGLRTVRFVLSDGAAGGTSVDHDAFVNVGRTVRDNFSAESYANNDGTDNWSGDWIESETGGAAGPSAGNIKWQGDGLQVTADVLGENIYRGFDLTGASSATLSFSYDSTAFAGLVAVEVQVSGDGGSSYRVLKAYDAGNIGSGSNSFALLGSELTANALVRVIVTGTSAGSNTFALDDVQVAYNLNSAPVLDASKSPVLGSITEDSGAPVGAVGSRVSTLIDMSGPLNNVSDADAGAQFGIAVIAANTSNGSWFYSTNNGSVWNALGAVSNTNAQLLAADATTRIYFQPNANYHGTQATALTFRAWDRTTGNNGGFANTSVNGGSSAFSAATDTASLTVNPVADTPTVTNSSTNEDTQTNSGLVISRNAADGAEVTFFKITGISNGTLFHVDGITAIANGSFISFAEGNAGLKFTPAQDFTGSASFTVQASTSNLDAGLGGGTATATITVVPVNDAPVITTSSNALPYAIGTGARAIDPGLGVIDIDSLNLSSATVAITTGYVNGKDVLAFTNQNGISGSWSAATGVLSLSGSATLAQYQAALRSVTFQSSATPSGPRLIAFQASDSAAALSDAAFRTVSVGQEVPALWISSTGNATTSAGTGGFSYSDGHIARLSNPNLALGSGISNGSFSGVFNIDAFTADGDANIHGLHYVSTTVTVGTTNAVTLQRGDILLSTKDSETLGGVAVSNRDVVLFRPTTQGDYSAGSFTILLRNPGNTGNNVRDFALVETAMTIGGTALQAGDFLMVVSSSAYDKDVQLFRPTTMATNPTGGTMSVLIDGDGSAGIGFSETIFGLELVQQNVSFGGVNLNQGQLLITLNGNTSGGSNNLPVSARDVFVLNITATGNGTSSGTASMLLRGADVGLTGVGEETDALALVGVYNTAPTLDTGRTPVLTAQDEDSGAPMGAVGTLVANLVDFSLPAGQVDNVSDPDTDAELGIAVIGANTANGSWWFSVDNGVSWNALGAVSTPNARLLAADAATRIYFQPNANYNGTIIDAISLRAWDRTSGSNGGWFNTSINGGASAFSSASDGANLTIDAVNDAPTLGNGTLAAVDEDAANPPGATAATIFTGQFADVDAGSSFSGIAVVGNTANAITQGVWQYSANGGVNWFAIGSVSDGASALALDTTTRLRFVPVADYHGTPTPLVVRGLDNTYAGAWSTTAGSESRAAINTTSRGGSTAIAAATASLSTVINPVADTPSVTNTNTSTNTQSTSGLVISRNPADGAEVTHFKITAISNGTLYKNDGVTVIADGSFITFAEGNAGLKFTPSAGFTGSAGFSVEASVSNLDAGLGGGTVNAEIAVNSAPTISNAAIVALAATDEDNTSPATTVDTMLIAAGWADADSGASKGIAITAVSGTGSWLYSTDGITWSAVGSVNASSALLLDASSQLRFQPDTLNGGPASLNFKAWDQTTGTASTNTVRGLANPGLGGGSSSYSSQSASAGLTVTPINDAPTLTDRALQFDGSDIVVVANDPSLVMSTTMTVEASIQRTGVPGGNQIIVNKEGEYELGITASGQLQWAFANSTPDWSWVNTSFTVPTDTWVRLAISYNAGAVKVYVDGVLIDSTIGSGAIGDVYPAMNDLSIGGRQNTTDQRFVGLIDEVRIWNVERSGAEIAAAYDTALAGSETGLVGYWRFSENSGTTAVDSSLLDNHGVLGNGIAADVPTRTGILDYSLTEDGSLSVAAPGLLLKATDPEGSTLTAVLVSGPANASSFTLNPDGSFIYTPSADFNGVDSFVFRVSDGSLESQSATVYLNVTPVNDAPTLANGSLDAVAEDSVDPPGAALSTIFSGRFADVDDGSSFSGVAVVGNTSNPATQGSWQYSTNGGGNWFAIGAVADGATALALDSTTLVRFLPVADFHGAPPALLVRALDNTRIGAWSTTAGSESRVAIDTSSNGGSTAIAAATTMLSTSVTAVADTPTVSNATTDEDTQSSSGLVISRNGGDGAEVLHFKITAISNGTLYKNDGSTVIADGDFIDFADANAGLKFTPTADFYGSGSFLVQASTSNDDAGLGGTAALATITVNPVNDAPTTNPVTLIPIAEDSGPRLITQAELLANAADIDGPGLTAINLVISSGAGSLVNNGDGSWTYTPALNDDTSVTFSYTVSDGSLGAAGIASLDITPVNDAPTTTPVTLAAIAEDSGAHLITQAELLVNAADVDGPILTAINLAISSGLGSLVNNGDGSWSYTPALNDDTSVAFTYTITDGSLSVAGSATLDITPVNDAPTTSPVTLIPIAEDSGARLITQAELLANAADIDGPSLTAINLVISSGAGNLVNNGDGSWSYTPAPNDDTSVSFSYTITDGSLNVAATAFLDITPVNDAPTTNPVTLIPIAEDSGPRLITQAELLANAADIDGPGLTAINLVISSGAGSLVNNGDGSWTYTPALNDDTSVTFSYTVSDGSLGAAGIASLDITPVNDAPTTTPVTLAAIAEDSGPRLITQAELLANAADIDGPGLTAINLVISSGAGSLVNNGDGSWTYTPALNDDTSVTFSYTVSDGSLGAAGIASLDITPVNDAPTTTPVTLAAIVEDSGARLITQAELLANAADIDGPGLTAINLVISSGAGNLVNNGDGSWSYTPALNDDTSVAFTYTITDGSLSVAGSATLDITPVNDAPTTSPVTLIPIAEDSGPRLITQAELLANAADIDGPGLTAINLVISSGAGSLVNNGDGSWTYTPALNDDTSVTFSYTVSDGSLGAAGIASLDITPVNDAPTTTPVTLAAIVEDSGARLITQAELLANAADIDGPGLTAINLVISSGAGNLVNNGDGSWSYTPALNDDTSVAFTYTITDGSLSVAGSATLDITPVNDAPTTSPVTLIPIAEDSGPRLITQAELLANAADIDGPGLTAINLVISSGAGSLVNNGDGSWTYTPALNDDTSVTFSYTVSDGSLGAAGIASLDITPVNDAPTTTPVTLAAIAEDSGARLITQAELLANAADIDGPGLTAINLVISSGAGNLVNNGDGSWSYTPALNDDTSVAFTYTITDGSLSVAGSATLDITPVNDAPTTSPVTLVAIAEDSGPRLITQAELLANAADIDGPSLTAINLVISSGAGNLVNNGDGSWSYTPALNDDTSVSFSYTITDGSLNVAATAFLDITPVNDAPTTSPVTLVAIAEDSGPRLITQAELLANAADIDGPGLTAINLVISNGLGSLVDNGDGSWTYTPALNDDTSVAFSYAVSDGNLSVAGSATLDITPVNDAPTTSLVTLSPIAEDSGPRLVTQAELLANAVDIDGPTLYATRLTISSGLGALVDNGNGTWTYTPAADDDTSVTFAYTVTDGMLSAAGSARLDISPVNDAPTTGVVTLAPILEDSGARLITQAELLAEAYDVDGPALTASGLVISRGAGTLLDNGNGSWSYTPAPDDDTDVSFSYLISDGSLQVRGNATLDILPVADAPTIRLEPLSIGSGESLPVDSALLRAASIEVVQGSLQFIVLEVRHGRFETVGSPGTAVLQFSQDDVESGRVVFVSTSAIDKPFFSIVSFDGQNYSARVDASIDFRRSILSTSVTRMEPIQENRTLALPGSENVAQSRASAMFATDNETVSPTADAIDSTTGKRATATLAGPIGSFDLPGNALSADDDSSTSNLRTPEETNKARRGSFEHIGDFGARVSADDYLLAITDFELMLDPNLLARNSGASGLHGDVSAAAQDGDEQGGGGLTLSDAARASAMALTAGTVWWALRAGSLLTGLMVSLPAWRHADLLAVLPDEDDQDIWDQAEDKESARDEDAVNLVFESAADGDHR